MNNEIKITARAKAFSGEGVREHIFSVDLADKNVRVWDSVAGHYTTCHSLTASAKSRVLKLAEAMRKASNP